MSSTIVRQSIAAESANIVVLRPLQLAWLAAAVFIVSAGYGALMPLLPDWLSQMAPDLNGTEIARHIGLLSGVYTAGVLIGAPLWGVLSDKFGRGRILIFGLIGYFFSLLFILVPALGGIWGLYLLRGMTGFFVAAVVPVVSALIAEYTPEPLRARRFAWLGSVSLLGFLFGPGLDVIANWLGAWTSTKTELTSFPAQTVIILSAFLGASVMLGLTVTMPSTRTSKRPNRNKSLTPASTNVTALWWLTGAVMFVLAAFELGIVLQERQHIGMSSRQVAVMFAECSLVMLGINALLFFTPLLKKTSARKLISVGTILATIGLVILSFHHSDYWMYLGISFTSAGTGLVLPVISYLAAGSSRERLGATMGGLAAAAGFGQTIGSGIGGWLFGALGQYSFGWLSVPLLVVLISALVLPRRWSITR